MLFWFALAIADHLCVAHSAIKLAKQVLRDRRQDLALWDGYARIERQRGKINEARQVYRTALSMYRSFPRQDQIDGPLLWRAWAEMEWEEKHPAAALQVLVAATEPEHSDLGAHSVRLSVLDARADSRSMQDSLTDPNQRERRRVLRSFAPDSITRKSSKRPSNRKRRRRSCAIETTSPTRSLSLST